MNTFSAESKISPDNERPRGTVGDYSDIFWGAHEPLRADGSPEKDYLKYILAQHCVKCYRPGGKAQRIVLDGWWCVPGHELSDAYLLPLCEEHDRELTSAPDKNSWWLTKGFRPVEAAVWLWDVYHATAERWMWREEAKAERATKKSK